MTDYLGFLGVQIRAKRRASSRGDTEPPKQTQEATPLVSPAVQAMFDLVGRYDFSSDFGITPKLGMKRMSNAQRYEVEKAADFIDRLVPLMLEILKEKQPSNGSPDLLKNTKKQLANDIQYCYQLFDANAEPYGKYYVKARDAHQILSGLRALAGAAQAGATVSSSLKSSVENIGASISDAKGAISKWGKELSSGKASIVRGSQAAIDGVKGIFIRKTDGVTGPKGPKPVTPKIELPSIIFIDPGVSSFQREQKIRDMIQEGLRKLQIESSLGNTYTYDAILSQIQDLASQIPGYILPPLPRRPGLISTGGYILNQIPPEVQPYIKPHPNQTPAPQPILNNGRPDLIAGLGEPIESSTWLWIMAGAAGLYLLASHSSARGR